MAGLEKLTGIAELIKIESSAFVLPFTYIGMLLAGTYTIVTFILITIALITARGAAFCANRYIGRKYDLGNPKKSKWISVRLYTKNELLAVFAFFAVVFLACAYCLNLLAFVLAPFVLLVVVVEPYLKKYTAHRHLIMGLVIGLGIFGGYIGASGQFPTTLPLYVLLLGYMCFSGGSDVIYSLNHVSFDKKNGLRTYPVKYGVELSKQISAGLHYWAAALFILFGSELGSVYIVAGGLIALMIFFFEHRNIDKRPLATTFLYYNAAVSLLMLFSVIITLY
jgi:4-hydroxybenzoate polyprenyltransferase